MTLVFPQPSNLQVKVLDAQAYNNCNGSTSCISGLTPFPDDRWIIEEDKTFWVDPNCTTNSSITTPGCPTVVGGAGTTGSTIPAFGVNFQGTTPSTAAARVRFTRFPITPSTSVMTRCTSGTNCSRRLYDGKYYFPNSLGINPANGKLVSTMGSTNGVASSMAGTNCTICVANPDSTGAAGNYGGGALFANYAPSASFDSTPAAIPTTEANYALVPKTDFFGNLRPEPGDTTHFDPGAVEFGSSPPAAVLSVTGGPLAFGNAGIGFPTAAKTLTLHHTGTAAGTGIALAFSSALFTQSGGTCTTTLAAGATCTINVVFTPTAIGAVTATLTITANLAVAGSPVALSVRALRMS